MKHLKHKILGYVYLAVIFAAVVSVIYYSQEAALFPDFFRPPPRKLASTSTALYKNSQYNFSANYDQEYFFDTSGNQQNFFRTKGKSLVSISIPSSFYPKTNFTSAMATFAVRDSTSASNCQYYENGTTEPGQMTETRQVNKQMAFTSSFSGAAAGSKYDTHLYHISHNNLCYEISLTIGIANIGNYPAGAVSPVRESDVWNRLNQILQTLVFTK